jgi:hypothetical protein
MGQVVDGRSVRDLTYNTRIGWLIHPRPSKHRLLLKAKPHPPGSRPRPRSVRNVNRRRRAIVRKEAAARLLKDKAARAAGKHRAAKAEGRGTAKDGEARTVDAREAGAIVLTTGATTGVAAIAAASKGRLKSISRS